MTSTTNSGPIIPLPLNGIRVVDFTTFLSGPFCTQILGDLGAEVIKIEPFTGDSSRSIPPHFVKEDSAYYLSTNRNKKSISINLKSPEGSKIAKGLIEKSDVVVENFRPGVMSKLGLDSDSIRKEHPHLVWASISGFGQHGQQKRNPAYDMIVQALSGVMSLTGEKDRPAVRLGIPAGDVVAGMYAAIAINASLAHKNTTGIGRYIDISMLDGQLSMLSYQAQYHLTAGTIPGPQGARHDSISTYRSFRAKDGREFVVTANTQRMWTELVELMELPELLKDPRFIDGTERLKNKEALWAILEPKMLSRDANDWVEGLTLRGVPAALIKLVPEAIADAKTSGRDMVVPVTHSDGSKVDMIGSPIKLNNSEPALGYPPSLSQNTFECLQDILSLSEKQIEELISKEVLLAPATHCKTEKELS